MTRAHAVRNLTITFQFPDSLNECIEYGGKKFQVDRTFNAGLNCAGYVVAPNGANYTVFGGPGEVTAGIYRFVHQWLDDYYGIE